jgi:hypothetical protein
MNEPRPIAHVRFDENNQPIEDGLDEHLRDAASQVNGLAVISCAVDQYFVLERIFVYLIAVNYFDLLDWMQSKRGVILGTECV